MLKINSSLSAKCCRLASKRNTISAIYTVRGGNVRRICTVVGIGGFYSCILNRNNFLTEVA